MVLQYVFFLTIFSCAAVAYGFDVKGLQPLQPNGVFSTFSTSTNQAGVFSTQFELEQSVDPTFYQINSSLSFAATDEIEASATIPYHLKTGESGFEDAAIGIKYRFIEEGQYSPSVAALLAGALPTGRDVVGTNGSIGGGLIASKKIGPFKTHANALVYHPFKHDLGTEVDLMLGAELQAANNLSVLTEVQTKKSDDVNRFDYWDWKIGYRFRPLDFLYTTLSAGYGFKTRSPDLHIFLSFTIIYPPAGKILKYIYEEEKE
ncbi:hypothetical protein [Candidatus Magnetominusculus dajiuhuensis]|uniref:hypothetical protein n=1 Tax=Candidatus Magnetominusculus dajiuhuensis TaxID=3137712 RepID=UPI003B4297A7